MLHQCDGTASTDLEQSRPQDESDFSCQTHPPGRTAERQPLQCTEQQKKFSKFLKLPIADFPERPPIMPGIPKKDYTYHKRPEHGDTQILQQRDSSCPMRFNSFSHYR